MENGYVKGGRMKKITFFITFLLGVLLTGAIAFAEGYAGEYRCTDYPNTTLYQKGIDGSYEESEQVPYDTFINVVDIEDGYLVTDSYKDNNGNNLYVKVESLSSSDDIKQFEETYGVNSDHFVNIYDVGDYYYDEEFIEGTPEDMILSQEQIDKINHLMDISFEFQKVFFKKMKLFFADDDPRNDYIECLPDYTFFTSTVIDSDPNDYRVGPEKPISLIVVDENKNPMWKFIYHEDCDFTKFNSYRGEKDLNSFGLSIKDNTIAPFDNFQWLKKGTVDLGYYLPDFNGTITGENGENIPYIIDEYGFVIVDARSSDYFTFNGIDLEKEKIENASSDDETEEVTTEVNLENTKNKITTFNLILIISIVLIAGITTAIIILATKE